MVAYSKMVRLPIVTRASTDVLMTGCHRDILTQMELWSIMKNIIERSKNVVIILNLIIACVTLWKLDQGSGKMELMCRGFYESPNTIICYEQ